MTTSSARPDYLQRYAMFVADRSNAARMASTRVAVALATYRRSSPDLPVMADAPTLADHALSRSDGMISRVRRVANAFTMADRFDRPVVVIHDDRFSTAFLGAMSAAGGAGFHTDIFHTEYVHEKATQGEDISEKSVRDETDYERGWRKSDEGTHTIGPVDLKGSYEVFAGAEVTRTSFFDFDKNGLDAAIGVQGFTGVRMEADSTLEAGVVSGRAHVEASVGVEATLGANARINLDEVHVDASGGVFVGGRVALDGEVEAMGAKFSGEAEGRAGIGADFSGEGHLGLDKVGFKFSVGLALGLGAGGSGGFSVNPRETVNDAVRVGTRVHSDANKVAKVARAKTEDLLDGGADLAEDIYHGGRNAIDEGIDFVRNPLGNKGTVSVDLGWLVGR